MRPRRSVAVAFAGSAALALLVGCSSSGSTSPSASPTESAHTEWSYSGDTGPEHWGSLSPAFAACGNGNVQSPIDIVKPKQTSTANPVLNYTATQATVVNTGHDIGMTSPAGNTMTLAGTSYEVESVHIHTPSENLLEGKQFAGEFHFKQGSADHRYTVLSLFVSVGEANAAWQPFIDAANVPVGAEDGKKISINWSQLVPKKLKSTIQFPGSLTTPPCTEGVMWTVDPTPITMSQAQLDTLKAIYDNNDRPVQPLNGRPLTQDTP